MCIRDRYDGTNLGYERRMFCLQGSDAHRVTQDQNDAMHRWGIGDRPSEALLTEPTFEALLQLFLSKDFDRLRVPFVSDVTRYNRIADARTAGTSDRQIMSASCTDDPDQMCRHVVALANSGGGTIFLGMDPDPKIPIAGLADATSDMRTFQTAVSELIFPQPDWSVDIVPYEGHEVIQIEVRDAQRKPCYMREQEDRAIYVRHNSETVLASHGDLIDMLHNEGDDGLAHNCLLYTSRCV